MKLTKKELKILYFVLNYHLNTIGEISTILNPPIPKKGDYLWEMEELEHKLGSNI